MPPRRWLYRRVGNRFRYHVRRLLAAPPGAVFTWPLQRTKLCTSQHVRCPARGSLACSRRAVAITYPSAGSLSRSTPHRPPIRRRPACPSSECHRPRHYLEPHPYSRGLVRGVRRYRHLVTIVLSSACSPGQAALNEHDRCARCHASRRRSPSFIISPAVQHTGAPFHAGDSADQRPAQALHNSRALIAFDRHGRLPCPIPNYPALQAMAWTKRVQRECRTEVSCLRHGFAEMVLWHQAHPVASPAATGVTAGP